MLFPLSDLNKVQLLTSLKKGFERYSSIIGDGCTFTNLALFEGELALWENYWMGEKQNLGNLPENVLDVINACDRTICPVIHDLLKMLASLPGNLFNI